MRTKRGEKEKLREDILLRAAPFLKTTGSAGAPVDKIMAEAGLTSGALYSHFGSKQDFFEQVIAREFERMLSFHKDNVERHGPNALAHFVKSYLSSVHITRPDEGCVFAALGADMYRCSPSARKLYEEKFGEIVEVLAASLVSGTKEERRSKVRFVFASMIGALTMARSCDTPEVAKEYLKVPKTHLLQLLEGENRG